MKFKEWMFYIIGVVFVSTLIYTTPILFPNDRSGWDPDVKIYTHIWNNINK
jgi:hypothetical protein